MFNKGIIREIPVWLFLASLFLPHALGSLFFVGSIGSFVFLSENESKPAFRFEFSLWPGLFLLFAWLYSAFSLLWTSHTDDGLKQIFFKLPLLLVPLVFHSGRSIPDRKIWSRPLVFTALAIGFYCLARVGIDSLLSEGTEHIDYHWLFTYENLAGKAGIQPAYLSLFFTLALLGLLEAWQEEQVKWMVQIPLALFLVAFIFLLSSRTGIIVCLLALFIWAACWVKEKGISLGFLVGISVPLAFLVVLLSFNRVMISRFTEALAFKADYKDQDWGSSSLRLEKWKNSLDLWSKNPVLGTGAGDFQHDLDAVYLQNGFLVGLENHFNSHNQYLQVLAQYGIIGFFFLIAFLVSGFYLSILRKDLFAFLVFLVISLSMLTESMLERRFGLFLVLVWAMVYASSGFQAKKCQ